MPAVVGIDLAAGRGITEVAALTSEDEGRHPVFDAATHRCVVTDADIVAAVAASQPIVVAIDAPLSLPRAVMRGLATDSCPTPSADHAMADNQTSNEIRAATLADSPYTRAAERDPIWSTLGIRPLPVSFLGGLTFRAICLLPRLRSAVPEAAIIEIFPSATLRCLDITQPMPGKKAAKATAPSRRIVQSGLRTHIEGIAEPDSELYGADLLDALAAALTGIAYLRNMYVAVGDPDEGAIILPAW